MIKRWIIKSNKWYDSLIELKDVYFFFGIIILSLLIIVILSNVFNIWWLFPTLILVFISWRIPYIWWDIEKTIEDIEKRDY